MVPQAESYACQRQHSGSYLPSGGNPSTEPAQYHELPVEPPTAASLQVAQKAHACDAFHEQPTDRAAGMMLTVDATMSR